MQVRSFTKPLHGVIIIVNGVFNNITEDIMEYVIEGTVKELKVKKEEGKVIWSFKIAGTEGYALRQKKEEDDKETRLNVLCLEDSENPDDKTPKKAIVLEEDTVFEIKKDTDKDKNTDKPYFHLLSLSLANGKKCRFCFLADGADNFDSKNCEISSLTLLAE